MAISIQAKQFAKVCHRTTSWFGVLAAGDYIELFIDKSDGSSWTFGSATASQANRLFVIGPLPPT